MKKSATPKRTKHPITLQRVIDRWTDLSLQQRVAASHLIVVLADDNKAQAANGSQR